MSLFFDNLHKKCLDFWSKRNDIVVLYREHLPFFPWELLQVQVVNIDENLFHNGGFLY